MPDLSSIMQDTMGSMFGLITILIGAIGVIFLVAGYLVARTPAKSNHWPTTAGQIQVATIEQRHGAKATLPIRWCCTPIKSKVRPIRVSVSTSAGKSAARR